MPAFEMGVNWRPNIFQPGKSPDYNFIFGGVTHTRRQLIGATNEPDMLDLAMLCPGRFDTSWPDSAPAGVPCRQRVF